MYKFSSTLTPVLYYITSCLDPPKLSSLCLCSLPCLQKQKIWNASRICVNHWQQQCPDKDKVEHKTYIADNAVLHQNDYDSPDELKFLMGESWSSVLLDCGASKTVCRRLG